MTLRTMSEPNEDTPLSIEGECVVERLLHYCAVCLIDLPSDGNGWLQCAGCDEPRCYECTEGCLCDRMKRQPRLPNKNSKAKR